MNRMKELREAKQITMKEAARRLGLPYTTYVNYEKNLREPNSETLIQIANFYNCSIDYLLGKSDDPINDSLLDEVNETNNLLLSLVGNPHDAKKIEAMFSERRYDEMKKYLASIIASVPEGGEIAINEDRPTVVRPHPQDDKVALLLRNVEQLNDQGIQKMIVYSVDLQGNPDYKKKEKESPDNSADDSASAFEDEGLLQST